jgi:protoheme IX farnesyltransferase
MIAQKLKSLIEMTKPRAMFVVLLTALAGVLLASEGDMMGWLVLNLMIGTALSGGGSIVLNQVIERDHDAQMIRTRNRPMPSGAISPAMGWAWGALLSVMGTAWLWIFVNPTTALLAGLSVASYAFIYTPLKRRTTLNTAVGAIPGAIPPMMGVTAVTGFITAEAWVLFAILFVWQFPHFLAIAWLHREDYARAGYRMLPVLDSEGGMTSRQIVLNTICLLFLTMVPVMMHTAGPRYAVGAIAIGLGFLALGIIHARLRTVRSAQMLLRGSIIHIAVLMTLLVADRI